MSRTDFSALSVTASADDTQMNEMSGTQEITGNQENIDELFNEICCFSETFTVKNSADTETAAEREFIDEASPEETVPENTETTAPVF